MNVEITMRLLPQRIKGARQIIAFLGNDKDDGNGFMI